LKVSLYTITLSGGYYAGPHVPLLDIFPRARDWGYDGIELEGKRPHGNPMDLDRGDRERIRKTAQDCGLEISCVAAYNDYSHPVDEHRENELLMTREQIRLAAELGAPFVRVFAAWSGVTRRDGLITYDVARYNIDHRYPGTTRLERWCHARDCLAEAAKMAEGEGVTLALQNHEPIISSCGDMLDFIQEVDSPALKACLDRPLMKVQTEEHYRRALEATGGLMVHSHFGGRFERGPDGGVRRRAPGLPAGTADQDVFLRLAREIAAFDGHVGYELCSPVLTGHRHEGLDYALEQAQLAGEWMRGIVDAL
jgi:sugar phosphate isomerase/epimerase